LADFVSPIDIEGVSQDKKLRSQRKAMGETLDHLFLTIQATTGHIEKYVSAARNLGQSLVSIFDSCDIALNGFYA
jgi:hypothetical protein